MVGAPCSTCGRAATTSSGSLEHLLVPDELEPRRRPASVEDAEVAEVAVALAARMLGDVRDLRREVADLRREVADCGGPPGCRRPGPRRAPRRPGAGTRRPARASHTAWRAA